MRLIQRLNQKPVFLGLAALLLLASNAFAYHPSEVSWAAEEFARAAEHFHQVIHNATGYSHLAQDVHRVSQDARHFKHVVDGGASYGHALRDFQRIRMSYSHLRRAFSQAHGAHHNWHIRRDFYRVQYAFEDVEYTMYDGDTDH